MDKLALTTEQQRSAAQLGKDLTAILNDPLAPIAGYAVAVIDGNRILYKECGGVSNVVHKDFRKYWPMKSSTRLRIASISKMFSAIAVMRLVEQGKLNLDADVSNYVGFLLRNPNYPTDVITLRMLLSHTSSLRDGSEYSIPPEYGIEEFFLKEGQYYGNGEHFADSQDGVERQPGVFFAYTNLNYGVIGTVLERISGLRFDEFMKKNILEPMGMEASFNVGDFDERSIFEISPLYMRYLDKTTGKEHWLPQIDDYRGVLQSRDQVLITNPDVGEENVVADLTNYRIGTNGTLFSPQGGLRISADELLLLIEMLLNDGKLNGKEFLQKKSVDLMFTPYWTHDHAKGNGDTYAGLMTCFGLGIHIMTAKERDRFIRNRDIILSGHFGEAYGLLAGLFLDRTNKRGILYIINGVGTPESGNSGQYSGMYRWEEKFCTAIFDNLFPNL